MAGGPLRVLGLQPSCSPFPDLQQDVRSGHVLLPLQWMAQRCPLYFLGHGGLTSLKTMSPQNVLCSAVSLRFFITRKQVANAPQLHPEPQGQARRLWDIHLSTQDCLCPSRPCQDSYVHTFTSRWAEWVPGFVVC